MGELAVKSTPIPATFRPRADRGQDDLGRLEIIRGHLQREPDRQRPPAGKRLRHDPVPIGMDVIGGLPPGARLDQDPRADFGAEIKTDQKGFRHAVFDRVCGGRCEPVQGPPKHASMAPAADWRRRRPFRQALA